MHQKTFQSYLPMVQTHQTWLPLKTTAMQALPMHSQLSIAMPRKKQFLPNWLVLKSTDTKAHPTLLQLCITKTLPLNNSKATAHLQDDLKAQRSFLLQQEPNFQVARAMTIAKTLQSTTTRTSLQLPLLCSIMLATNHKKKAPPPILLTSRKAQDHNFHSNLPRNGWLLLPESTVLTWDTAFSHRKLCNALRRLTILAQPAHQAQLPPLSHHIRFQSSRSKMMKRLL